MVNCCVCGENIGLLQKKIEVDKGVCHIDCWLESTPGKVFTIAAQARIYFDTKNYRSALKEIEKGLSLQENSLGLLALKAMTLGNLEKTKESLVYARQAYKRFEEIYGKDFITNKLIEVRNSTTHNDWLYQNQHTADLYADIIRSLALDYMFLGQYKKAIPLFEEELNIYPNATRALDNLIFCFSKIGDFKKTNEYIERKSTSNL